MKFPFFFNIYIDLVLKDEEFSAFRAETVNTENI